MRQPFIILAFAACCWGQVHTMRDCIGVIGGMNDDTAALQACVNANPGKDIHFDKNQPYDITGGHPDYHTSAPLKMNGVGQSFSADPGTIIRCDHSCILTTDQDGSSQQIRISDLTLWSAASDPASVGIEVNSPGAIIERVISYHFGVYGLWIHSGTASSGDLFRVRDSSFTFNGSDGIRIEGGDAQVGITENVDLDNNGGYGLNDSSFLGNTHIQPHARTNTLGGYYCKGNPQVTTFVNPYSEQDQPANIYKPGCLVIGGVDGAGHDPQSGALFFDTQGYVGTGMFFKNPNGNVLNRFQSNGNYLIFADKNGNEQWRLSALASYFSLGGPGGQPMHLLIQNGTIYWADTHERHGTNFYEDWTAKITGGNCGTTDGIAWNPSPIVGDPVGWRCINNIWHAFGAIQ